MKGILENKSGKKFNAINSYKRALGIDARKTPIYKFLGDLLIEVGAVKEGAHYLLKGLCFSQMSGKEDVFVFGDSHASACFSGIPRCKVFDLSPMTMHRVGRDRLSAIDFRTYGIPARSTVCFIFGFIDIRTHIIKQKEKNCRDIDEILSTLVQNYTHAIQQNHDVIGGCKVILTSVIPPTGKLLDREMPEYPTYGSLPGRAALTAAMNNLLRDACQKNGYAYMDVYKYFADPSGILIRVAKYSGPI